MDPAQLAVTIGGLALIGAVLIFFFGPRRRVVIPTAAAGAQEVDIVVKGGYAPDVIVARQGQRLRLRFNRQETAACSDLVVFPDLGISRDLLPFSTTIIEFVPERPGEYTFTCGMNMLRGRLIVEPS